MNISPQNYIKFLGIVTKLTDLLCAQVDH